MSMTSTKSILLPVRCRARVFPHRPATVDEEPLPVVMTHLGSPRNHRCQEGAEFVVAATDAPTAREVGDHRTLQRCVGA